MIQRRSLSIRTYIILLIVIMTIIPFGLIVYLTVQQRNHEFRSATLIAEGLSNEVSTEQRVLLSSAEQLLSCLAYIPSVNNRESITTSRFLAGLLKKSPEITNILLADAQGHVWASAQPMHKPFWVNDRRYFKEAMTTGKFSSGEFTYGRVVSKPIICFGFPIKDQAGKIQNVAIIGYSLTNYQQVLKMKQLPEATSLVLTDHAGTILFDALAPRFIGKQDKAEVFQRMTEGPDRGAFEAVGNTGKGRFFACQKLYLNTERVPYMYVRAGILRKTVAERARNGLLLNAGIMSSITILAFGFALYFSKRSIVDKITALRQATQQVAQGDLDIHVSRQVSGGELGELAHSFDTMAHTLAQDKLARKKAENEIRQLNQSLEDRVRERTRLLEAANIEQEAFSYSVSHDLRSPLRHINSYLAIMKEECGDRFPAEAAHYMDRACAACIKMGRLIDDLLALSRVGRAELIKESVDLSELAEGILAVLQETEPARAVELVIAQGLWARGDKNLLFMVLMNLLGNAWKYTSRKEMARLEFGAGISAGHETFFVRDNGAGFDMAYHDKLFGAFQRLHGEEYEGTGIGLATVKRIIERHGGTVWAEGEVDKGATFFFTIPGVT